MEVQNATYRKYYWKPTNNFNAITLLASSFMACCNIPLLFVCPCTLELLEQVIPCENACETKIKVAF